jgi:hypothetical protein
MKTGLKQSWLSRGPDLNSQMQEKKDIKATAFLLGLQNFKFMKSREDYGKRRESCRLQPQELPASWRPGGWLF